MKHILAVVILVVMSAVTVQAQSSLATITPGSIAVGFDWKVLQSDHEIGDYATVQQVLYPNKSFLRVLFAVNNRQTPVSKVEVQVPITGKFGTANQVLISNCISMFSALIGHNAQFLIRQETNGTINCAVR